MLIKTGVATKDMIASKFPSEETLKKPKAILECFECIPCNPCATSCPFDAIVIEDGVTSMPYLLTDKCTGCGQCVIACPGLAITIAQLINNQALFKIPYEFKPSPLKGEIWHGLNRSGDIICEAEIKSVQINPNVKTALVTVLIPKQYLYEFSTIKRHE